MLELLGTQRAWPLLRSDVTRMWLLSVLFTHLGEHVGWLSPGRSVARPPAYLPVADRQLGRPLRMTGRGIVPPLSLRANDLGPLEARLAR